MPDLKYIVTLLVDEETLRDIADAEPEETTNDVLKREFGWLVLSGIIVEEIKQKEN